MHNYYRLGYRKGLRVSDLFFKVAMTVLSIALLIVVILIVAEIIAHRRPDKYFVDFSDTGINGRFERIWER